MAHSLKNIMILRAKGVTFICLLMDTSKNEALKKLNNSVTYDKGVVNMNFSPNETPTGIIKEGAFGDNYLRDIY